MLTITLISLGTPMILMGDEIAHSQKGNNNGYCQDNPTFWFDWRQIEKNRALFNFTKALIKQRTVMYLNDSCRYSLHDIIQQSAIVWHGVKVNQPDWGEDSHAIAMESKDPHSSVVSYVVFNAFWHALNFELPVSVNGKWLRIVDTSLAGDDAVYSDGDKQHWFNDEYLVAPRSVIILIG